MSNKKISVYMGQGLGNQLFVYSYILNLVKNNSSNDLKINILFNRKSNNERKFLLGELINLDSDKISFSLNNQIEYFVKILLYKIIKNENILRKFHVFHEQKIFTFEKELLRVPKNSLVRGQFISKEYTDPIFLDLKTKIAKWLSFQEISCTVLDKNFKDSIILHFRRGDTVGKNAKTRGLLTSNYYDEAIRVISKERNFKPKNIIAITDDLKTSKKDFKDIPVTDWFGPDEIGAIQALKVFVNAPNFVGSNSTLSWWGAKLSSAPIDQSIRILPFPWLGFKESIADQALFNPSVTYIGAK